MQRTPDPRVPRLAGAIAFVFILGVTSLLVNVAWKSNAAVRSVQPTAVPTQAPQDSDAFSQCTSCHGDLDNVFKRGRANGLKYRHEKHFAKGVSDCAMCHPANVHVKDKINKPSMMRCFMCHGLTKVAIAPGACTTCHPANFPTRPRTHTPRSAWRKAHGTKDFSDGIPCATCHETRFCAACHRVTMPHAQGWKKAPHIEGFFEKGLQVCTNCHPRSTSRTARDFCDKCHHRVGPTTQSWLTYHPTAVKKGGWGKTCFTCHATATCEQCHKTGRTDFDADRKAGLARAATLRR